MMHSGKDRDIIYFYKGESVIQKTRDESKEVLQLVIIFIGRHEAKFIPFRIPGAIHPARCMAKVIC